MKVGCDSDKVKAAGGWNVKWTTSLTVITALIVVLAATAAGCSSHRSPAVAEPSGSSRRTGEHAAQQFAVRTGNVGISAADRSGE